MYLHTVIVMRLVQAGAEMLENNEGQTPLVMAEVLEKDDIEKAVSSYLRCKCT